MSPSVVADYDTDDANAEFQELKAEVKAEVTAKLEEEVIAQVKADTAKLKAAMGPLKLMTEAVAQLNEALKTKDAAIAQLRETIRERDSVLFALGRPQPPTPLIDELLQSSQIAVDKFRDLVILYGDQLQVEL
jgi:UDP-N-acetylmuramyl pentapeptide synthase